MEVQVPIGKAKLVFTEPVDERESRCTPTQVLKPQQCVVDSDDTTRCFLVGKHPDLPCTEQQCYPFARIKPGYQLAECTYRCTAHFSVVPAACVTGRDDDIHFFVLEKKTSDALFPFGLRDHCGYVVQ